MFKSSKLILTDLLKNAYRLWNVKTSFKIHIAFQILRLFYVVNLLLRTHILEAFRDF